mgnify:CR=1 FL=1
MLRINVDANDIDLEFISGTERQSLADMAKLFDFAPALEVQGKESCIIFLRIPKKKK